YFANWLNDIHQDAITDDHRLGIMIRFLALQIDGTSIASYISCYEFEGFKQLRALLTLQTNSQVPFSNTKLLSKISNVTDDSDETHKDIIAKLQLLNSEIAKEPMSQMVWTRYIRIIWNLLI